MNVLLVDLIYVLHFTFSILYISYIFYKSKDRIRKVKTIIMISIIFFCFCLYAAARSVGNTRCLSLTAILFKTDLISYDFLKSVFPSAIFITQMTQSWLTDLLETISKIVLAENQCFVLQDKKLYSPAPQVERRQPISITIWWGQTILAVRRALLAERLSPNLSRKTSP